MGKKMHGKFPRNLHEKRVDKKQSYGWLKFVDFMGDNYENNQRVALYGLIYYSKSALHVSGNVFTHHQEHLTVFTASCGIHQML